MKVLENAPRLIQLAQTVQLYLGKDQVINFAQQRIHLKCDKADPVNMPTNFFDFLCYIEGRAQHWLISLPAPSEIQPPEKFALSPTSPACSISFLTFQPPNKVIVSLELTSTLNPES
jgi:hypothetical protein